jgi:hypothetical protein
LNKFVTENWKGLLGLIVYIAVGYASYQGVVMQVETNERRLGNYIKVIKQQQEHIHTLDKRIVVLETKCK